MLRILQTAAVALGLLAAGPALANDRWTVDSSHADVVFKIDHLGFSSTWGRFGDVSGTLVFDPENAENGTVEVVIAAASIDTNFADRDKHLRGGDFFHTQEFPEATFRSTRIEVTGENTANITGDLTMLGVTRPVVLSAVLNKVAALPQYPDVLVAGFSATTSILRSEWGLNFGVPAIGDQVDIFIDIEATRPAG